MREFEAKVVTNEEGTDTLKATIFGNLMLEVPKHGTLIYLTRMIGM